MVFKFQFVEVNTLKLFLSQWNQYNHAETFLRGIVSAWLSICDYSGLPQPEKRCLFIRNETNSKNRKREKPCRTSIFAKRKRLIVSDTLVSKLSTLFGGGDGNWTRVRKRFNRNFSGRSRSFTFPHPAAGRQAAGFSSFIMRGTGKAYRTHVHHSSTPQPIPWSWSGRRWLIKQPGEQSCCCSLIYKSTHFKDVRRIRPLFLPPHPRRNRNTPSRCRKLHIPQNHFPLGKDLSSIPLLHLVSHHIFFYFNSQRRIVLWIKRCAAIVGAAVDWECRVLMVFSVFPPAVKQEGGGEQEHFETDSRCLNLFLYIIIPDIPQVCMTKLWIRREIPPPLLRFLSF